MNHTTTMSATFEAEKNRKAAIYTAVILGSLLLITFLVSWTNVVIPPKPIEEAIEINLGNDIEGFGEVQPLIKGEKSPADEPAPQQKQASPVNDQPAEETKTDDNDPEAAPVTKPVKTPVKVTPKAIPTPVPPAPKPQKPKIAGYNGPKGGTGNGATEDNGYKYQGNKPGGTGDAGSPNGKPDSYGKQPGGKTGGSGLQVSKGDRRIVNNYIFMDNLPPAVINAKIKVSPAGRGVFTGFDKGSTSTEAKYAEAIRRYLPNIEFDKSDHQSDVTVPFKFRVQ
jgi:outer membrane biosynthesis protein TonB